MTASTTTTENDDESDSFHTERPHSQSNRTLETALPTPSSNSVPYHQAIDVYSHYFSSDCETSSCASSYSGPPPEQPSASYPYSNAHEGRRIVTTINRARNLQLPPPAQPQTPREQIDDEMDYSSEESPLDPYLIYLQENGAMCKFDDDDYEDRHIEDSSVQYANVSALHQAAVIPKLKAKSPPSRAPQQDKSPAKRTEQTNMAGRSIFTTQPKRQKRKESPKRWYSPKNSKQQSSSSLSRSGEARNYSASCPFVTAEASPRRSPKPKVVMGRIRIQKPQATQNTNHRQPGHLPPLAPVLTSQNGTDTQPQQTLLHTSQYCSDDEVSIASPSSSEATPPVPASYRMPIATHINDTNLSPINNNHKHPKSTQSLLSKSRSNSNPSVMSHRSRSNTSVLSKRSSNRSKSPNPLAMEGQRHESYPSMYANCMDASVRSNHSSDRLNRYGNMDASVQSNHSGDRLTRLKRGNSSSSIGNQRSATISRSLSQSFRKSPSVHKLKLVYPQDDDNLNEHDDNGSSIHSMEDDDQVIDFLQDPINEMTWGRHIALSLMKKTWYNPKAQYELHKKYDDYGDDDDEEEQEPIYEMPSLGKAWAYFEHVVLTRYFVEPHIPNFEDMGYVKRWLQSFKDIPMDRSQPGESLRKTKLYDPMGTPHSQLGDFGLGFGLYFATVRAIGYITFFAGLLSSFNMYFFASGKYYEGDLSTFLLRGSAICTNTEWVPCVDCSCDNTTQGWDRTSSRCANVTREIEWPNGNTTATTNETVTFILKNHCLEDDGYLWKLGFVNFGSVMFLLLAILSLSFYLKDQRIKFDEDEQTAQDYSILISNPPPKATDPDVWKRFFENNFEGVKVAAITCAVNNDLLIRALVKRREVLRMMELQLDPGTPMDIDNLALLAAKEARKGRSVLQHCFALILPGMPELLSRLVALNTSIKGLAQLSYPCTNVFVTFENEADQRLVLTKLAIGYWHVRRNNVSKLEDPQKHAFQGHTVLDVQEAVEPNAVRWQDLNVTLRERIDQMVITNILTGGSILVVALIVSWIDQFHVLAASFSIAAFNLGFPEFAKLIVMLESHPTESKVQTSLYFKIAVFRWVNTAIVITVITPFTHTLAADDGLIPQIYAIFFSEIITTNLIQLSDPWGHFLRHIVAPRASTQDSMNLLFQGLEVEIAERYTNMTKIMFLAFWYSSIFPGSLFLCSAALAVNYYTDRFSMMRTWKRAPRVSTEISTYSRRYFMSSACVILVAMSSFYWSAYPFDNLCMVNDDSIASAKSNLTDATYYGDYEFTSIRDRFWGEVIQANVEWNEHTTLYRFCNQDFILKPGGPTFPFLYKEGETDWMTDDQQQLAFIFGWASVTTLGLMLARLCRNLFRMSKAQFFNVFQPVGKDQGVPFHNVTNISGYIPQVKSWVFSYPLIACKIDKIGEHLFDWTDPDRDYQYYDITKDADHVLNGTHRSAKHSFSRMKHWPPETQRQQRKKSIAQLKQKKRMSELRFKSVFNSNGVGGLDHSRHGGSDHHSSGRRESSSAARASMTIRSAFPALFLGQVSEADNEDDDDDDDFASMAEESEASSGEMRPPKAILRAK